MKDEEKKMIKNLFCRLQNTEYQFPHRDQEAEKMIHNLSSKQSHSIYYMVQTILVQESVINRLNNAVKLLKNKNNNKNVNNTSFLSNQLHDDIFNHSSMENIQSSSSPNTRQIQGGTENVQNGGIAKNNTSRGGGTSSFLSNALQTAVGVAGGMVAGNMLTNLFNHDLSDKSVDNILNTTYLDSNPMTSSNNVEDDITSRSELPKDTNISHDCEEYVEYQDSDVDDVLDDDNLF
ncbi:DUF2076 domain-containing protein [Buchnera aphidicola]|uniref:DUF2076 domain-containing protein n=1 Tax=Buchnera aphidicola (Stegophylla sp.) TaxID=2315800 RepID=A0A4D6YE84_9GAMM|nr:DUF2076 domain-containing protein [Buchnera aphidicola (Stegophylla sp.)]QCI26313.1 DUF2076 domain-containing protein [Buchnera aphidicola (Stegophylla sp.)]